MTLSKKNAYLLIAVLSLFSLIAAACGNDDDATTSQPAAEPAEEPAAEPAEEPAEEPAAEPAEEPAEEPAAEPAEEPAEEPEPVGTTIKLGIIYSETGRSSSAYNTVDTVGQAWAEWVNAELGGVNGHPVEVLGFDGESTGEGAAAAAREAVESEGVVGVVIQDTTAENAIAEYLATQGVPMIGGTANGRPQDSGDVHWPNIYFNTSPSNPATAASTMLAAAAIGASNFSAAVCAEVPACAQAGGLYGAVAPGVGLEYVGLVTVGAADPSYTAPCLELVGLGSEFINLGLAPSTAISVIDECAFQGFDGTFGAANNSVVASDFEELGVDLAGGLNGFPWWADAPGPQQFRDAMETYGGGVDARNPSATSTWAALELFRKAMSDYGPAADAEVTAADVIGVYHQIDGETLDGLLPSPISYVADGYQPVLSCFWMFHLQGGAFSSLAPSQSGNGAEGDLATQCFSFG